ncbi:MAG: hypothetical protein JWQ16_1772 [Novosphingobium sp.]|nr:hypothetical protein [Novosphingobium sp.]
MTDDDISDQEQDSIRRKSLASGIAQLEYALTELAAADVLLAVAYVDFALHLSRKEEIGR